MLKQSLAACSIESRSRSRWNIARAQNYLSRGGKTISQCSLQLLAECQTAMSSIQNSQNIDPLSDILSNHRKCALDEISSISAAYQKTGINPEFQNIRGVSKKFMNKWNNITRIYRKVELFCRRWRQYVWDTYGKNQTCILHESKIALVLNMQGCSMRRRSS